MKSRWKGLFLIDFEYGSIFFCYSRRESNAYGFVWQIFSSAADKMLAISYITAHFLFASAKYLFTQNCKAPSGVEIFDGFSQSELKQDADLARRDLAKDAKIARRRAYAFDSLRLLSFLFYFRFLPPTYSYTPLGRRTKISALNSFAPRFCSH